MKKILSLILAMAIILSCFATGMVFSASAEAEYLDVLNLACHNWQLSARLGVNGTGYANGDAAPGVTYVGSKTYHAEPGENYVSEYFNANLNATPSYPGHYIFSSKSGVFINDETAPQYFRYQPQLAATEENSVIIYVELPDYVAQNEDWGLGFYRPADAIGEFRNASGYCRFFKRTENITEGFSYLSVDGKKWENGIIYAQADGEKVIKTNLPSGFKGYIRLDLSKLDTVINDGATVRNDITTLHELDFAFNAVGAGDFVLGGLMYAVSNSDSTTLNFNGLGVYQLTNVTLPEHIKVSGLSGNNWSLGNKQGINGTGYAAGADALGVTYTGNKTHHAEPGENYMSNYTNTNQAPNYSGNYIFSAKSGVYKNLVTAPEYFRYQSKLDMTQNDTLIMYVEVPDYEAAGETWGLGFYKPAVNEFTNSSGYARYFKRDVDITQGFSYLSVDGDSWVNGTMYKVADGEKVMKTNLPSGFKGYIRFDFSKMTFVNGNGDSVSDFVYVNELDFAYNAVGAGDFVLGGLMYRTTNADANVLNFNYAGYVPMTNNILSVRAQNIITDTANTTNATGTNLQVAKGGNEASANAVMSYGKSGGLFLDDGYAASFKPDHTVGNGVIMGINRQYYNTVADENLNLQLKAGVNKFMFYVELPDVRDFEGITDEHSALATQAIYFTNGGYVTPYGTTYEYMDIRDGVWHESTIISDTTTYTKNGVFSGLPTDGFKGYIKMDLNGLVASQTTTYTISSIKLAINRFSWGRPLVIGGFYAIDVDSSATKPYFIDTNTGEMAATEIVPCDFTGDNVINAADLTIAIKYLIDHPDVTGIQASRAVSLTETKGKFTTVTLVQMKKVLAGNFTPATLQ